jgi:transcriptional regulator with XRE-family HTH domain
VSAEVPSHLQLGEFLRVCRDRLRPADVGLPSIGRRRAPGLRREEVATLAGVSIDYLVRLEQGRDQNPSPAVLQALATALRLDDDERETLWRLSALGNPGATCPIERAAAEIPATVLHAASEVLGSNRAWRTIAGDLGIAAGEKPILVRYLFLDPRAHTAFPDWDAVADAQVAAIQRAHVHGGPSQVLDAVVAELLTVPAFEERWNVNRSIRRPLFTSRRCRCGKRR